MINDHSLRYIFASSVVVKVLTCKLVSKLKLDINFSIIFRLFRFSFLVLISLGL